MTKIVIIGSGESEKAKALVEKLQSENDSVEIIRVQNMSELREKGIVVDEIHEDSIMTLKSRPEIMTPYCPYIEDFRENGKKGRYQKREYRKPASFKRK